MPGMTRGVVVNLRPRPLDRDSGRIWCPIDDAGPDAVVKGVSVLPDEDPGASGVGARRACRVLKAQPQVLGGIT